MIFSLDHHDNVLIVLFYICRSAQMNMNRRMRERECQMFNFKDARAITYDFLATFSNSGIEDLRHTEVKHATPFRSFT